NESELNKILNELPDKDPEELWIYINSKLEGFFGHDMVLKPKEDEKLKIYLKLIDKFQNYLVILWKTKAENIFKIVLSMQKIVPTINNFEDEIIEFSNVTNDIIEVDLVKIKRDLIERKSNHNEIRDQMKRLEHFVDLKQFYIDL
ncbi:9689_t:CDS:2, partial [Gigaspora margarita]